VVGVASGLKSPVLEAGALPDIFKVRSMIEDSNGPYGHVWEKGCARATCAHGTERATQRSQPGNMMGDGASSWWWECELGLAMEKEDGDELYRWIKRRRGGRRGGEVVVVDPSQGGEHTISTPEA
jgi:hypothetical protein